MADPVRSTTLLPAVSPSDQQSTPAAPLAAPASAPIVLADATDSTNAASATRTITGGVPAGIGIVPPQAGAAAQSGTPPRVASQAEPPKGVRLEGVAAADADRAVAGKDSTEAATVARGWEAVGVAAPASTPAPSTSASPMAVSFAR